MLPLLPYLFPANDMPRDKHCDPSRRKRLSVNSVKRRRVNMSAGNSEEEQQLSNDMDSSESDVVSTTTTIPTELPLVVVIDARDCTQEVHETLGMCRLAFCDAKIPEDITDKVFESSVGIFVWHNINLTREVLQKFKRLRLIIRVGSTLENIDVEAAGELGILVSYIPGCDAEETADFTIGLILGFFRNIFAIRSTDSLNPSPEETKEKCLSAVRIRGQILGLVGLGRVGMAVALRAKMFGFHVLFYDPYVPDGIDRSLGITRVNCLNDLLVKSDCVSLHCAANHETKNIMSAGAFKQMKPGSFFINTAAGSLVNEEALAISLNTGLIKAAAIDVHRNEPFGVEMGPLKDAPNLVYTRHIAYFSNSSCVEARVAASQEMRRLVTGLQDGTFPTNLKYCVNTRNFANPCWVNPVVM